MTESVSLSTDAVTRPPRRDPSDVEAAGRRLHAQLLADAMNEIAAQDWTEPR